MGSKDWKQRKIQRDYREKLHNKQKAKIENKKYLLLIAWILIGALFLAVLSQLIIYGEIIPR
jgi:hypothetical protein